jgi:uncharacterized membrane protein
MEHLDNDSHDDADLTLVEGLTTSRIETLGDGVFAIAMTILVLNLKTPADLDVAALPTILSNLWPQLVSYFLSFVALGTLWIAHHNQYHWIQFSNRKFLWLNIFFFSFVCLIPFTTTLLQTHQSKQLAVIAFGANYVICLLLLYSHWTYATHKHRLIADNLNHKIIRRIKGRIVFTIMLYLIGLMLSYINPALSILMFVLTQLLSIIPSTYDRFLTGRNHPHR